MAVAIGTAIPLTALSQSRRNGWNKNKSIMDAKIKRIKREKEKKSLRKLEEEINIFFIVGNRRTQSKNSYTNKISIIPLNF